MESSEDKNRSLYKFEYYDPDDGESYTDWVWLADDEINGYKSGYSSIKMRPGTKDEEDLYNEAYADGYGIAALMEFEAQYDGITYRVELDESGSLDFQGTKMFECALCSKHKDFETEVAIANDFFLGTIKDKKLWHVCFDCVMMKEEIDGIEIEPEA